MDRFVGCFNGCRKVSLKGCHNKLALIAVDLRDLKELIYEGLLLIIQVLSLTLK